MQAHLIVVGKLKDKNLTTVEERYLKRIKNPQLIIHEVKARAENKDQEADVVFKKIQDITKDNNAFVVALTEFGIEYASPAFSKWLYEKIETHQYIIFVIAGAEGHGDKLLAKASAKLSLSKLTFPHKIARVLFVEQFYRAMSIRDGHPYHN